MKALFGSRSFGIPLGWGLSQSAGTLLVASNAWFLSGLSSSPLINTLLPVFGTLPILLSLRRDVRAYGLEIFSAGLLVVCLTHHSVVAPSYPNSRANGYVVSLSIEVHC